MFDVGVWQKNSTNSASDNKISFDLFMGFFDLWMIQQTFLAISVSFGSDLFLRKSTFF